VKGVDRQRLPVPAADRPFRFPRIAKRTLDHGLEVRAVSHRAVPITSIALLVRGGSSADPEDRHGLTSLTAALLDEGSRGQSALDIADRVARMGGDLDLDIGPDAVVLSLTTLDRFFASGLALLHEMVTEPNLAEPDFTRLRDLRLERFRQLRDSPPAMADRAFAHALYQAHPYGHLGIGSEAHNEMMTVDDVRRQHAAIFLPSAATLVVAGDRDAEELLDLAARAFESWDGARLRQGFGEAGLRPGRNSAALEFPPAQPMIRLGVVPRAGAAQSELRIGLPCAARSTPDYHALVTLNAVLGGQFVSRINLNLREQKGYTYGVQTAFDLRCGIGPFVLRTSVASNVTADAIREALGELGDIAGPRPITADELTLAHASIARGFPRGFETANQVARSAAHLSLHELPDSYFEDFVPALLAVRAPDVTRVAQRYLDLARMTTLIVGDLDRISASLGALDLGEPVTLSTARL
jgi:predicted Zn-dependent peptidase